MRFLTVTAFASTFTAVLLACASPARADDVRDLPTRIGLLPSIGVGMAGVGKAAPFPGFVGLTMLGAELHAEVPPYGAFFRFQFLSSGDAGHWNSPSFALGASYRFIGDGVQHLAVLGRAGVLYERWHATTATCPVDFFVPTNCKTIAAPAMEGVITNTPPDTTVTGDQFGLLAGVRLEMPIRLFYLAFDAEVNGLVDVAQSSPGTVIGMRFSLVTAFRDVRDDASANDTRYERQRRRGQ